MRWFMLTTMLIIAAMSTVGVGVAAGGKSMRLPADPASTIMAGHPLVGRWVEVTAYGEVPVVFNADGTVTMRFPNVTLGNQGNAFVSGGAGTWEPVGIQGATYTVVRPVSHANGIDLGTITIQGYLELSRDGATYTDDGSLTVVTTRNAYGQITSVTGANNTYAPAITAARVETGIAFEAHGANLYQSGQAEAVESTVPVRYGGGCNTCR